MPKTRKNGGIAIINRDQNRSPYEQNSLNHLRDPNNNIPAMTRDRVFEAFSSSTAIATVTTKAPKASKSKPHN